jgi:hypothetical protein
MEIILTWPYITFGIITFVLSLYISINSFINIINKAPEKYKDKFDLFMEIAYMLILNLGVGFLWPVTLPVIIIYLVVKKFTNI